MPFCSGTGDLFRMRYDPEDENPWWQFWWHRVGRVAYWWSELCLDLQKLLKSHSKRLKISKVYPFLFENSYGRAEILLHIYDEQRRSEDRTVQCDSHRISVRGPVNGVTIKSDWNSQKQRPTAAIETVQVPTQQAWKASLPKYYSTY